MTNEEIEDIATHALDLSLPKAKWTHEAHFATALWLLRDRGDAAYVEMPDIIRRYNEATGGMNTDTDGYHHTITLASLGAARMFMSDNLGRSFSELISSDYGRSDWVFAYWSKDVLFSVDARRNWREPDLAPLPFSIPETS